MRGKKECLLLLALAILLLFGGCGENPAEESKGIPAEIEVQPSEKTVEKLMEPTEQSTEESTEPEELLMLAGMPLESAFLYGGDHHISPGRQDDLNGLFADNGFVKEAPFYTLSGDSDIPKLTLYYNEETETGIGLLYDEPYTAFGFTGISFVSESSRSMWEQWQTASAAPPVGEPVEIKGYYSESEYDENGRLVAFRSYGDLSDVGQPEEAWITEAEYTYDEYGALRVRYWARNPWANEYGTTNSSITSYFDDFGRVIYERCYITHGSIQLYYIYEGESMTPAYCLFLDLHWPEVAFADYGAH